MAEKGESSTSKNRLKSLNSETSTENDAQLEYLSYDLVDKLSKYAIEHLQGTMEEYNLLENMNLAIAQKYKEMGHVTEKVKCSLETYNAQMTSIRPHLEKIQEIHKRTCELEEIAYKLDSYVKLLELTFKNWRKDE
ncbi:Biogenesis of lysosome-related organelles complex 1 subunit 2 [Trichinella nelsoni]|uniref:Biogenesis of lysosome-related organelles complex 1 subunit 2 n=7 Tax=Trichinella TaxID=6333 RepID=A0A0V1L3P1_9BILA